MIRFTVPDNVEPKTVLDELDSKYTLSSEHAYGRRQKYYDTFDWRLFEKELVLMRREYEIILHTFYDEKGLERIERKRRADPRFWWDFQTGALRDELKSIIDVRALLPLIELEVTGQSMRVLNEDQKTVCYLRVEEIALTRPKNSSSLPKLIYLKAVRGYADTMLDLQNRLLAMGLQEEKRHLFGLALRAGEIKPGSYSSKLDVPLSPDMSAGQAARKIWSSLIDFVHQNEAGIRADLDTEFLHDFRVALRRTRAGISQIRDVLTPSAKELFNTRLAELQKVTNRLRDLDVYLINKEHYKSMLPDEMQDELESLFLFFESERKKEFSRVKRFLLTKKYKETLREWEQVLENGLINGPSADMPVTDLACQQITRRYRRILKRGTAIVDDTPDSELHALRIDCKKLRYLLEFFISLFPQEKTLRFIKQLKKLQDNLGEFNDLSMQKAELRRALELIPSQQKDPVKSASAIGGLIALLHRRQQAVRRDFGVTFQTFAHERNADLFHQIFG